MSGTANPELTFIQHVHELRKRLLITVVCVGVSAGIGWALFDHIIAILSKPFQQTLFYSAPTGELSFTIKVCLTFGLVVASPMVFYQLLRFIQPALNKLLRKQIIFFCCLSTVLAIGGAAFAYFVSLPLTLQFLLNMNSTGTIEPLISVDEYFNFVLAYIAGFALLFQIPIFVLIINKITPLTPTGLFKSFRYVVLFSFIASAIITPTPDPINQTIMAVPVIVLYFISALMLIAVQAARRKPKPQQAATTTDSAQNAVHLKANIPDSLLSKPVLHSQPLKQIPETPVVRQPQANIKPPQSRYIQDVQRNQPRVVQRPPVMRPPLQRQRLVSDFI